MLDKINEFYAEIETLVSNNKNKLKPFVTFTSSLSGDMFCLANVNGEVKLYNFFSTISEFFEDMSINDILDCEKSEYCEEIELYHLTLKDMWVILDFFGHETN